jgi:hypothetical protein
MQKSNIAIILTTFLRPNLAFETIQTIQPHLNENTCLLIGDQSDDKNKVNTNPNWHYTQIFNLPYDCGLSFSRNFLVQKAHDLGFKYVLLSADSIQFNQQYNFQPYIDFLERDNKRGILGFELNGSKCPWEFWMDVIPTGIKLNSSNLFIEEDSIKYKKCDIIRNIFLAKTETLLNLWDNDMKLAEHELAFLEYKKRGYEVYWTDSISFDKVKDTSLETYNQLRDRFGEYKDLLKKKLNITGWVTYSPEAMREIKEYKAKHEEKR